ncbi:MAG: DotU family type VI secretion system protein [Burkholderiales bacterium]|nr:DotU family type VI secretion system protein [Burkholderiales bacterium]
MPSDPSPLNDPFAELDRPRGFVRPQPGGWSAARAAAGDGADAAAADAPPVDHGLTPLLALANRLLLLVPQLRATRQVPDPSALRAALAQGVREFATAAQAAGIAPERVMAARYVLCTALDEAAADTPWGGGGTWGRHSLLAEFHNEGFGGEKVFQLMARLAERAADHVDLLELIHAALALGFEGRYRVVEGGRNQLEAIRAKLAQIIRRERGPLPQGLAPHWQGRPAPQPRALTWLPLAVAAASSALLLGAAYAGYAWSLAGHVDPVHARIQQLRLAPPVAPVAQPAPQPRLAHFLQADIRAGLVDVRDEIDRSVVTIRGDGLFAAASAALAAEQEPLMARIADAVVRAGGQVLVTGHTDNTPMRSLRFPSNWHLSEARAGAVRDLLVGAGVPAERIRAEGRADGEPLLANDTPANRARNRRVEILVAPARPEVAPRAAAAGSAMPDPSAAPAPAAPGAR